MGQAAFPHLAKQAQLSIAAEALISNVATTIVDCGKHNRVKLIRALTNGLPASFVIDKLNVSSVSLKKARESRLDAAPRKDRAGRDIPVLDFRTIHYSSDVWRKTDEIKQSLYSQFFVDTTGQMLP